MVLDEEQQKITDDIKILHDECFDSSGTTRNDKRWNDGNFVICVKHGITYDKWLLIRRQMIDDEGSK